MYKKILFVLMVTLFSLLSCYDDGILDSYDDSFTYNLRDRGPAGGWIFYINPNYKTDGWRYLEAAPVDQGADQVLTDVLSTLIGISAQGTAVGTGKTNTAAIVNQIGCTRGAAKLCSDYRGGGFSDWFLPSKDELFLMCWILRGVKYDTIYNPEVPNAPGGGVGNFIGGSKYYWNSSEFNSNEAWGQSFESGEQVHGTKGYNWLVRAIRAF